MIVSAQDDYFRLRRQKAFETLRQGHSGKTAAHNHNSFGNVWHDVFSFLHVQMNVTGHLESDDQVRRRQPNNVFIRIIRTIIGA